MKKLTHEEWMKNPTPRIMFLILKTTDWKEENYIKSGIVPFGWCEDNNRAIPNNEKIVAKVQTETQRDFLLEKLNNKYVKRLREIKYNKL